MPFNLGTTGIGSHPLNDPERVIQDIFSSKITHPYVPQLRTDEMIYQFHYKFPGLSMEKGNVILDLNTGNFNREFEIFKEKIKFKELLLQPHGEEITAEKYGALYCFSELLSKSSRQFQGIKCQMTGPITEAASIKIRPGKGKVIQKPEFLDMIVSLSAEIAHWLSSFLLKLAETNNIAKNNVLLFLDEPLFPLAVENEIPYEDALEKITHVLKLIQCKKGIHICDDPISVIDIILKYPFDLFSYDGLKYSKTLKNTQIDVLQEYIARGGGFAFGITPNTPEALFGIDNISGIISGVLKSDDFLPAPSDLIHTLQKNIHPIARKGIPIQQLLAQSVLTPACGFRNFNIPSLEEGERIVLRLLELQEQAARIIRKDYGLATL
ncbi:MAG: hypothetical protein ACTSRC_05515 [Candidatus Helarchaeota archaeon]